MVYYLVQKYDKEGIEAYKIKKVGRPSRGINSTFIEKVVEIRKRDDYGSEKIHFVLKKQGFAVSRRQIQKILDINGLTEPCEKGAVKENMFVISGLFQITCGIVIGVKRMANNIVYLLTIEAEK